MIQYNLRLSIFSSHATLRSSTSSAWTVMSALLSPYKAVTTPTHWYLGHCLVGTFLSNISSISTINNPSIIGYHTFKCAHVRLWNTEEYPHSDNEIRSD